MKTESSTPECPSKERTKTTDWHDVIDRIKTIIQGKDDILLKLDQLGDEIHTDLKVVSNKNYMDKDGALTIDMTIEGRDHTMKVNCVVPKSRIKAH